MAAQDNSASSSGFVSLRIQGLQMSHPDDLTCEETLSSSDDIVVTEKSQDTIDVATHYDSTTDVSADSEDSWHPDESSSSDIPDLSPPIKKKKALSGLSEPKRWQRPKSAELRMKGKAYKGRRKDINGKTVKSEKEARKMGNRCMSAFCKRVSSRTCDTVTEEQRSDIFNTFWGQLDWKQRKTFVASLVLVHKKKGKRPKSRRSLTYTYHLRVDGVKQQVCKNMFLSTLGLREWTVHSWAKAAMETGIHSQQSTSPKADSPKFDEATAFLESLPTLPSHYCRQNTTKVYLQTDIQSKTHLYKLFQGYCDSKGVKRISRQILMKAARKMNIGFWKPKKDQCNLCAAYAFGNCEEEEYVTHLRRKEEARAEKTKDKRSCEDDSTVLVVCMDLQVVLLAPSLLANASYFKTKLCCHNFTLYDLARHDVSCYFWDETRGDVSSNCFASCICDFISNVIASQAVDTVILYSDGCGYQNRNVTLSNSLLHLAMTKQLTIYQKFLEKGHTFMEVDSVHSAIERKLRGRQIYWPADYIEVMESARTTKAPYVVKNLDYSFFKDFSGLKYYRSIRPGNSVGEPQVTYIRALLYTADGHISYKLHLSDSWSPLPRRPNRGGAAPLTQLYTQLRPIKLTKFRDLQQLKHVIPREYHEFYNSLPHQ